MEISYHKPRRVWFLIMIQQDKYEGFDSCDPPSNLTQIGFKSSTFQLVWPWNLMDDLKKNNRASLLHYIKLCASLHHHMWNQTGVMVWKPVNGVLTSVTLTFDLWPWSFAWTSFLPLVITPPHNFMMIRWWEHSEKGVTDRQTDGQTEPFIELLGRS